MLLLHYPKINPPIVALRNHNTKLSKLVANLNVRRGHLAACSDESNLSDGEIGHDPFEKLPERNLIGVLRIVEDSGVSVDASTFNLLLDHCLKLGSIIDARRIHAKILKLGFDNESLLCGRLANVYLCFGGFSDAVNLFNDMSHRSSASWNALVDGLLKRKENDTVLMLFSIMMRECENPTAATFSGALRACIGGGAKNWSFVQQIHGKTIGYGLAADPLVGNPLIDLYSKNGHINSARKVFDELCLKDNVSWVAMVSGFSQNGLGDEAIELYRDMHRSKISPTPYVFSSLLSACAKGDLFVQGMQFHAHVLKLGFSSESFVGNSLLTFYSRCRNMRLAELVFSEMPYRDEVTYNAMISGHVQYGDSELAMRIFTKMQTSGMEPDCVTIASLLSASAALGALEQGKQLHAYVLKSGLSSDYIIEGSILDLYVRCADIEAANDFFNTTNRENVVLWNVMLVAYGQMGNLVKSFDLFYQMQLKGLEPNQYTYPSILRTCTFVGAIELGEQIHCMVIKTGFEPNVYVSSVLIDMYAKCGRLGSGKQILESLTEEDVVSWTAMIAGYAQHEHFLEALATFNEMQIRGIHPDNIGLASAISACAGLKAVEQGRQIHAQAFLLDYSKDISIGNALVNFYARCGQTMDAYSKFKTIENKDEISWNGLISGFAQSGNCEEALRIFVAMDREGIKANLFTYGSAISAAANIADVKQGTQIHARLIKTGYNLDIEACNAIITLYGKCGCIEDAKTQFFGMSERNEISWNAIITCYSQHGNGRQALEFFEQMKEEGYEPNNVTFLAVLAACSHVGLVDKGVEYFSSMSQDHGVSPKSEHYACLVDILGRSGQLERARGFIEDMPVEPDAMVWRTLLSACTVHKNMEIGEFAAQRLLELEPHDSANYVLLSNIYALSRKWYQRDQVRLMMKERGVKKEPGQSWVEAKNAIHAFFVGDRLHPLSDAIYNFLEDLNTRAVNIGYIQDKYCLLNEVELGLKDPSSFIHSEKLAVAFALMSLSPPIPVRVMKNLRVCNDCHSWMKFVSRIEKRPIILRDAYRFHHFEEGSCSCRDYW